MARIREEEKARIRQSILDESKKMFSELGYDGTSTKKIASAVGIAEGTIFNYFKTKGEIYLEVMVAEYAQRAEETMFVPADEDVASIITEKITTDIGFILKLPRKVIVEIAYVMLNLSKNRPELIKTLIDMDFRFLASLQNYIEKIQEKGMLTAVDAKDMSEIVYGTVAFEIMMYYYEQNTTKEDVVKNIQRKLQTILKGYVQV